MTKKLSELLANPLGVASSGLSYFGANVATATGWVGNGTFSAPTTTVTTSDLPLAGIYATAIKFTSPTTAGTEGTNDWSYSFTTPKSGGVKTSTDIYMVPGANFIASEWTVSVFQSTTKQLVDQQDSSGFVYLPVFTGLFRINFMLLASTAYTIRVCRRINAGANVGVLNAVIDSGIGQRNSAQNVGGWLSWTPSFTGLGTVTSVTGKYKIVTDSVELLVTGITGSGGTAPTAVTASMSLPLSNWTIDDSVTGVLLRDLGTWNRESSTATHVKTGLIIRDNAVNHNLLYFAYNDQATAAAPTLKQVGSNLFAAGQYFEIRATVPITQLSGIGLNFGQNTPEVASNSGVGGTAANTDYTTGSVYGAPSQFVAITSTDTTSGFNTRYAVSFQRPIQVNDRIWIEAVDAAGGVFTASPRQINIMRIGQNNAVYGMWLESRDAMSVWVVFGNAGRFTGATYGGTGAPWSAIAGSDTYRWKVIKATAGQDVPYGPYVPGLSTGLVDAAGLKGNSGTVPGTGYVGQEIISTFSTVSAPTSGTRGDITSITLPAGTYEISANAYFNRNAATMAASTVFVMSIVTAAGNVNTGEVLGYNAFVSDSLGSGTLNQTTLSVPPIRAISDGTNITIAGTTSAGQTVRLKAIVSTYTAATPTFTGYLRAVRVA